MPAFPAPLDSFLTVTELDEGATSFGPMFQHKFRETIPDFPCHLGVFLRLDGPRLVPLSYLHFRPFGDIMLVGGGCTDGRAFALMTPEQCAQVKAAGGILLHNLRYGFERFADRCDAFFGYCGDPRAYEVDMQAGFVPTPHERLIARWHKPLDEVRRRALIAKAHAIGPF